MQEQLIQTLLISAKNIGSGLATIGLVGAGAVRRHRTQAPR